MRLDLVGRPEAGLLHCEVVIKVGVAVEAALPALVMLAVRGRAKVVVTGDLLAAQVAHVYPTTAPDLIAAVGFDKGLLALWTLPDLGGRDGLLDSEAALGFRLVFDFVAAVHSKSTHKMIAGETAAGPIIQSTAVDCQSGGRVLVRPSTHRRGTWAASPHSRQEA